MPSLADLGRKAINGLTVAREKVEKGLTYVRQKTEQLNDLAEQKGRELGRTAAAYIQNNNLQPYVDKAIKAHECYKRVKREVALETPKYL